MACSHTSTCPLFPLISVNNALKVWKTFYCEGKYTNCARYNLSLTGQGVPANLLPNGKSLTTGGMATGAESAEEKADLVQKVAPQIVEEMVSLDLDQIQFDDELQPEFEESVGATAAEPHERELVGDTSSWYLRIKFNTDTGVVANVIQTLGRHRVKIDAMAEKRHAGKKVAMVLVILTDQTTEAGLAEAIEELRGNQAIVGSIKKIKLEYLSAEMFD
jgi:hypothetical protein